MSLTKSGNFNEVAENGEAVLFFCQCVVASWRDSLENLKNVFWQSSADV